MKIQSGRIQRVGLNQRNGFSLGFVGLGQNSDTTTATGFDLSQLANPSGTGTGSDVTGTSTSDPGLAADVMGYLQNLTKLNATTPQSSTTTTQQPFQWGALLMGAGALVLVIAMVKKK